VDAGPPKIDDVMSTVAVIDDEVRYSARVPVPKLDQCDIALGPGTLMYEMSGYVSTDHRERWYVVARAMGAGCGERGTGCAGPALLEPGSGTRCAVTSLERRRTRATGTRV
jgi:hypothetical protein